uniref:Uncharacterized protein n=1 Tax=Corvus moneduloides TaxID=1196302 RepID=A0A8C3DPI4_CORMO
KYYQWLFLLFSVILSNKIIQTRTGPGLWNFTVNLTSLLPFPDPVRLYQCHAFYVCPASNPGKSYCNYPEHYYCGYWGYETIASNWIPTPQDKNIKMAWGPPGSEYWLAEKIWKIRFWESRADRGSIFKIIKERSPHDPAPIGPNNEIKQHSQSPPTNRKSPNTTQLTKQQKPAKHPQNTPESFQARNLASPENRHRDPFWNLMQASYQALNKSRPNLTEECWLCYSVKPPYYESDGTNPRECPWSEKKNYTQGITIQSITGKRKCLGIIPTSGAKWVCSNIGLTPCLSIKVLDTSQQFCVQVMIVPRLMYHTSEEIMNYFEGDLSRQKREPLTAITIATLLITGGVRAGTGVTSIVKSTEIQKLQMAVDEDLGRIEQSIENLATSVKSLSEVVLQNRRGLDLLFLKERGLCAALKEECCFFADHTGVVKDSMSELQKRLDQRKKDQEMNKSWYEGWFSATPWLTTLLSALAGPLIIIILGLMFGPCISRYKYESIKRQWFGVLGWQLVERRLPCHPALLLLTFYLPNH